MPLDGFELFENQALAKLYDVERLLTSEDRWCKGRLRDRNGRHCLVGAMAAADARRELARPVMRAVREISGKHYWRIASYNDDPSTTHEDILRVLRRTRQIIISNIANSQETKSWQRRCLDKISWLLAEAGSEASERFYGVEDATVPVRIDRARPAKERVRQERVREPIDA